jgi:Sec-independent protein translocase protein TatA
MDKFNVFSFRGGEPLQTFDTEDEALEWKNKQVQPSEYFVEGTARDYYTTKLAKVVTNRKVRPLFDDLVDGLGELKKTREEKIEKAVKSATKRVPKGKVKVQKQEKAKTKIKVKNKTKPKAKVVQAPTVETAPVVLKSVGRTLEDIKRELAMKKGKK